MISAPSLSLCAFEASNSNILVGYVEPNMNSVVAARVRIGKVVEVI